MKELENKVALVSSSTRGIGLACAKTLAAQGAAVYLGVRRLEAGQQIADELIAAGGRAGVVFFDASREESFSGMVDEVAAKEGRLDILVNNFGSTDVKTDLDVVNGPSEDFFRIVNTNLKSVYLPSKAAVPLMAKNGGGSIINIGSVIGEGSMIDMGAVLGGRATVGKNCHIGAGTVLAGVVEPASATPVIIEDDVMIGANAVVLEGVHVGKGAVVAAGAVCVEDVPAGAVVAGVPARAIKMRDEKTDSKTGLEEGLRQL